MLNDFLRKVIKFTLPLSFFVGSLFGSFGPVFLNVAPRSAVRSDTEFDRTPNQDPTFQLSDLFSLLPEELSVQVKKIGGVPQNLVFVPPQTDSSFDPHELGFLNKLYFFLLNSLPELETAVSDQNLRFSESEWSTEKIFFDALKLFLAGGEELSGTLSHSQLAEVLSLSISNIPDCYVNTDVIEVKCTRTEFAGDFEIAAVDLVNLFFAFLKNIWQKTDTQDRNTMLGNMTVSTQNGNREFLWNKENINIFLRFFKDNPSKLETIIENMIFDIWEDDLFFNSQNRQRDKSLLDILINGQIGNFLLRFAKGQLKTPIQNKITTGLVQDMVSGLESVFNLIFAVTETARSARLAFSSSSDSEEDQIQFLDLLFAGGRTANERPSISDTDFSTNVLLPLVNGFIQWEKDNRLSLFEVNQSFLDEIEQIVASYAEAYFADPIAFNPHDHEGPAGIEIVSILAASANTNRFSFSWNNDVNRGFSASVTRFLESNGDYTYQLTYFARKHWSGPLASYVARQATETELDLSSLPQNLAEFLLNNYHTSKAGFITVQFQGRRLIFNELENYEWEVFEGITPAPLLYSNNWRPFAEFGAAKQTVGRFLKNLPGAKRDSFVFNPIGQATIEIEHDYNGVTKLFELTVLSPGRNAKMWTTRNVFRIDDNPWITGPTSFLNSHTIESRLIRKRLRTIRKDGNDIWRLQPERDDLIKSSVLRKNMRKVRSLIERTTNTIITHLGLLGSDGGDLWSINVSDNSTFPTYTVTLPMNEVISSYRIETDLSNPHHPFVALHFQLTNPLWKSESIIVDEPLDRFWLSQEISRITQLLINRHRWANWFNSIAPEGTTTEPANGIGSPSLTEVTKIYHDQNSDEFVVLDIHFSPNTTLTNIFLRPSWTTEEFVTIDVPSDSWTKLQTKLVIERAIEAQFANFLAAQIATDQSGEVMI